MDQLLLQAGLAVVSWLGILLGWLSGYRGQRRIRQPFSGIITNMGVFIMIAPWVVMPLLAQPRLTGSLQTVTFAIGALLLVIAALITIWATPFIFPAAKKGGDELDPEFLVITGPYQWVRHPQYVGAVIGFIGWALLQGGLYSLLMSPIFFLLFRFEAYLEESRVLEPKFGEKFRRFKEQVPAAFFGGIGTIILMLAYVVFVSLVAFPVFFRNGEVLPLVIIAGFIISALFSGYFYIKSVRPAALEKQIGSRAWPLSARYRQVSGIFMGINMLFYILYFLYPLPGLVRVFPWDYPLSVLLAILIGVPSGYIMFRAIYDAGEEAMTPKKEHRMYRGIYTRIRHPMALGELQFVWVISLLLNSPVLLILSVVWVPVFYQMCIYEEKDLVLRYGDSYVKYMRTTGRFIPKKRDNLAEKSQNGGL